MCDQHQRSDDEWKKERSPDHRPIISCVFSELRSLETPRHWEVSHRGYFLVKLPGRSMYRSGIYSDQHVAQVTAELCTFGASFRQQTRKKQKKNKEENVAKSDSQSSQCSKPPIGQSQKFQRSQQTESQSVSYQSQQKLKVCGHGSGNKSNTSNTGNREKIKAAEPSQHPQKCK